MLYVIESECYRNYMRPICEIKILAVNMHRSTLPSSWRLIKEVTTVTDSTDSGGTMSPTLDQRLFIKEVICLTKDEVTEHLDM